MKSFGQFVFILLIIAAVAYYTKPTEKECLKKASKEVKAQVTGDFSSNHTVITKMLDGVVQKAIRVEDRFLYQSISYAFGGRRRPIGWGAFGMVHISTNN